VGRCTSGGFGWRVGKSLALAMVPPALAVTGTEVDVAILGKRHRATVIPESPFDAKNERLRG
jgi:dimethylglycine dehydrogenase